MDELVKMLEKYMLEDNTRSIGQAFKHFADLGYSKKQITDAMNVFSMAHIAQTTEVLDWNNPASGAVRGVR